jgi:hypothetical protein
MSRSKLLMGGKKVNGLCDSTTQKGHLGRYSDRKRLEDKGSISDVVGTVESKTLASQKKTLLLVSLTPKRYVILKSKICSFPEENSVIFSKSFLLVMRPKFCLVGNIVKREWWPRKTAWVR